MFTKRAKKGQMLAFREHIFEKNSKFIQIYLDKISLIMYNYNVLLSRQMHTVK